MSHLPQQLRKVMGLQAVPIVNKSTFAKMVTALPESNEEIKNISSALGGIQDVIENKKLELSFYKSIKTGLMQDLLTGKVRVDTLMEQIAESV